MGSNSDGQLGVGRNPEWTSVPIQIHGMMMMMTTMASVPIQIHGTSMMAMMILLTKVDSDDDDDAQEWKVGWFSLPQGLFIVLR